MAIITKEQAQAVFDLKAGYTLGHTDVAILQELARIALASLEAEPVGYADPQAFYNFKSMGGKNAACTKEWMWRDLGEGLIPLFTSPPAPVVDFPSDRDAVGYLGLTPLFSKEQILTLNACRAAMLHGADGKPELTVWYGAMPETNGKTNWTAILHRKGECLSTGITIDRSEYPERVRYEADRMRYLIGEYDKRPCIIDYDADAHSGYVPPAAPQQESE